MQSPLATPNSDEKELLWGLLKEHTEQGRMHETQRERMVTLVVAITAGTLGVAAAKGISLENAYFGWTFIALGVYGALFARKHYERNRFHVTIANSVLSRLEEMYPSLAFFQLVDAARVEHEKSYPLSKRVRLNWLWSALPLAVTAIGILLLIKAY